MMFVADAANAALCLYFKYTTTKLHHYGIEIIYILA